MPLQKETADAIAKGEEPPWDALYAPPDMHHYLQGKTVDVIARGEKPPWDMVFMLRVVFMLHQQPRVLLIHQLKKLLRKVNLSRHIARMA
jgi:hypothetical protein